MQVTLEKGEQDLLIRQIKQILPTKYINGYVDALRLPNNAVAALKKLVQMDYRFDVHAVRKMVRARLDQLRYFQCQVAAKNNLLKDIEIIKNAKLTNKLISRLTKLKCCQRLRVVPEGNGNLKFSNLESRATQNQLAQLVMNQSWRGVCDVEYNEFGRGVITTAPFAKGDFVLDYHGLAINSQYLTCEDYVDDDPINQKLEYIVEVLQNGRHLIDASSESCPIHKDGRRCLGRRCNSSPSVFRSGCLNKQCNLKLTEWICNKLSKGSDGQYPRYEILVARVDISELTQLLYDYMDRVSHQLFS